MKEYILKTAQDGFAAGTAFCAAGKLRADDAGVKTGETAHTDAGAGRSGACGAELARLETAVAALEQELSSAAAKAGEDNAAIFEAERLLLNDERFIGAVREQIREKGMDAASAVTRTGKDLAAAIDSSGSEYIRQRSEDVTGMTTRLLGLLSGNETHVLRAPAIVVAEELSPAQLAALDAGFILGIVTAKGAPTSHVAILAGNLGIPYCYGSEEAVAAVHEGSRLILGAGKLTVDPAEGDFRAAIRTMEEEKEKQQREQQEKKPLKDAAARTKVYANITGPQDIDALIASGAEGVGLFRSEFLFLDPAGAPSEEAQFQAYRSVAEAMAGKETVIRTMDLGADKKADWLRMPAEANPALGCRGLRLALQEKELFRTQLRALLRAAACGNVKIMIPMVASVREVDAVRERIETCAKELTEEGIEYRIPPLGIMVETPAAALIADQLAEKVDFFSIGTNDLTQYTLALDREAQGLDAYYDPFHDAVLRLVGMTAAAGHERNIPTAVCGELAGNPAAIGRLIERGVDELSVSISKIEATKAHVIEAENQLSYEPRLLPEETPLGAPADGTLIPMEEIPDAAFSAGTLGECVGILPENGNIYAPCDGIVSGIAETKHAITFTAADGRKILVHAGLDTVTLGGRGFTVFAKAGQAVKKGDLVMESDLDVIRAAGLSPMVITACCP